MKSKKSLVILSLLLSACGTNNTTDSPSKSESGRAPAPAPGPTGGGGAISIGELKAVQESVVNSKKHVIVNAANQWLAPGGALSGAIFAAAGADKVLAEIAEGHNGISNKLMSGTSLLKTSEVFTTGAYDFSTKPETQDTQYIIHALGPDFRDSPYSSSFEQGYAALSQTYKNLYAEMARLNQVNGVTTIGVIPISAGVFVGSADKNRMYKIMVDETLSAMKTYPALQPELYLFGQSESDDVKQILQSAVAKMAMPAALSASVARASTLTLMEAPVHTLKMGTLNFQGVATSLGFLRIMGGVVESVNESLTQLSVGKMNGSSFVGCEFETAYLQQEHAHFSVKATGAIQISDGLKLAGGIGYIRENLEASLSRNVRNFLNLESKDYERNGVTCDVIAQHQLSLSSTVSFTTNVGITAKYTGKAVISPFLQVSCNIEGLGVAAVISQQEFGFNFHHSQ
jgi:O-acetyl-ADP-ribose deacetylase (regulator of RNase III)